MGQDESKETDTKINKEEEEDDDDYFNFDQLDDVYKDVELKKDEYDEKEMDLKMDGDDKKEIATSKKKECPDACPTKIDMRYSEIKCIHMPC